MDSPKDFGTELELPYVNKKDIITAPESYICEDCEYSCTVLHPSSKQKEFICFIDKKCKNGYCAYFVDK